MIAGLKRLKEKNGLKILDAGGHGDRNSEKHFKNILGVKNTLLNIKKVLEFRVIFACDRSYDTSVWVKKNYIEDFF